MKLPRVLKLSRIVLSVTLCILIALLFMNTGGKYLKSFSVLAKIQFLPAVLSLSIGVIVVWLGITLVVGRVYCSSVCPLGTLQDFFSWLHVRNKKKAFHYKKPKNKIRYTILFLFALSFFFSITSVAMLIAPYSAFGRIVNGIILPVKNLLFNGGVVELASYTVIGMIIGGLTLVAVALLSFYKGRFICNVICPVGSALSAVSRYSIYRMEIDTDKCVGCGQCAFNCKTSCINLQDHTIDTSRCVMCLNCIDACRFDALHFVASRKRLATPLMQEVPNITKVPSVNIDRRKFLMLTGAVAVAPKIAKAGDVIDELEGSEPIKRRYAVNPPGAESRKRFHQHCTSCMLCVSNCPNKVLKPSVTEYGVWNIMQPTMDFDKSFCKEGCTRCSNLCPTGALLPLTKKEKLHAPIGLAQVIKSNCIGCGVCAESCPYHAITMVEGKEQFYPNVNADVCIGCGACQYNCPASPVKAIWVEGKS